MSTPDHLRQLPLILTLSLSQQAREITDLIRTMQMENQAFQISQTPHDAGRVANVLRHIAERAAVVALEFESARRGERAEPPGHGD